MDPNFNGVWSASEIDMARSFLASHNTYTNDTNKKHNDFVDDLQAMFPWKEKHLVTDLYVKLVVEMTMAQSNNQHVVASGALVNEIHTMIGLPHEQPHMPNVVPKKRRHAVKFWTTNEHRSFILAWI